VTSKLQVTIPKAIADRYGIAPGQDIDWLAAGDAIRIVPHSRRGAAPDATTRLALFDAATDRQRARQASSSQRPTQDDRGWRRDELYPRAGAR
jgi:bifunctional DNA-binding transcriptional regulator/antitoxin component of YhaV-PrlF toxin-antitoxin module